MSVFKSIKQVVTHPQVIKELLDLKRELEELHEAYQQVQGEKQKLERDNQLMFNRLTVAGSNLFRLRQQLGQAAKELDNPPSGLGDK